MSTIRKAQTADGSYRPVTQMSRTERLQHSANLRGPSAGARAVFPGMKVPGYFADFRNTAHYLEGTASGRSLRDVYSLWGAGPGIPKALKETLRPSTAHKGIHYGESITPAMEKMIDAGLKPEVVRQAKRPVSYHYGMTNPMANAAAVGAHHTVGDMGRVILNHDLVKPDGKIAMNDHPAYFGEMVNHELVHASTKGKNPFHHVKNAPVPLGPNNMIASFGEEARADAQGVHGAGLYQRMGAMRPSETLRDATRALNSRFDLTQETRREQMIRIAAERNYQKIHARVQQVKHTHGPGPLDINPRAMEAERVFANARRGMVVAGVSAAGLGAVLGAHAIYDHYNRDSRGRFGHGKRGPMAKAYDHLHKADTRTTYTEGKHHRTPDGRFAAYGLAAASSLAGTSALALRHDAKKASRAAFAHAQAAHSAQGDASMARQLEGSRQKYAQSVFRRPLRGVHMSGKEHILRHDGESWANATARHTATADAERVRRLQQLNREARSLKMSGRAGLVTAGLAAAAGGVALASRRSSVQKFDTTGVKRRLDHMRITPEQARHAGVFGQIGTAAGSLTGAAVGGGIGIAVKHPAVGAGVGGAVGGALGGGTGAAVGLYSGRPRKPRKPKTPVVKRLTPSESVHDEANIGTAAMGLGGGVLAIPGRKAKYAGAGMLTAGLATTLHAEHRRQRLQEMQSQIDHDHRTGFYKSMTTEQRDKVKRRVATGALGVGAVADASALKAGWNDTTRAVKPTAEALKTMSTAKKVGAYARFGSEKAAFPLAVGGIASAALAAHVINEKPKKLHTPKPSHVASVTTR